MKTKERRHTNGVHQQFTHFLIFATVNSIGDAGVTSLSESLKSNTTLTKLYLRVEDKRKKTHKCNPSTIHSFPFSSHQTDSNIGERGATSLSEALKSNTTLTEVNLSCKDKRKKTHK